LQQIASVDINSAADSQFCGVLSVIFYNSSHKMKVTTVLHCMPGLDRAQENRCCGLTAMILRVRFVHVFRKLNTITLLGADKVQLKIRKPCM
jgi:hypothetical protein